MTRKQDYQRSSRINRLFEAHGGAFEGLGRVKNRPPGASGSFPGPSLNASIARPGVGDPLRKKRPLHRTALQRKVW